MKLVVAGTRNLNITYSEFRTLMNFHVPFDPTLEIVSGHSGVIDLLGEEFAAKNNLKLHALPAAEADALFLVWDGISRDSASLLKEMKSLNKPVIEIIYCK